MDCLRNTLAAASQHVCVERHSSNVTPSYTQLDVLSPRRQAFSVFANEHATVQRAVNDDLIESIQTVVCQGESKTRFVPNIEIQAVRVPQPCGVISTSSFRCSNLDMVEQPT